MVEVANSELLPVTQDCCYASASDKKIDSELRALYLVTNTDKVSTSQQALGITLKK
jgi:hypothetical protein